MASRYTAEALLLLRQSPLCVKPPNLPPAEQWMGPPPDTARAQQPRPATDRPKTNEAALPLDQATRRPVGERSHPRNLSNSEPLVLGPPKTNFNAAAAIRNIGAKVGGSGDADKPFRDQDLRDRFAQRTRSDQTGAALYAGTAAFGGSGGSVRDTRNPNFRRRGDADQDSDGWSTVKPRKSFGHEGAERFQGRMGNGGGGGGGAAAAGGSTGAGGGGDRFGERRPRDRDDNDLAGRDRPRRTFDRDAGDDNNEAPRRNGLAGRGNWLKDGGSNTNNDANDERTERGNHGDRNERPAGQRDRIERSKNWRERDPASQQGESMRDRTGDRGGGGGGFDRRWGRDADHFQTQRHERDPEWMNEDDAFADDKPSTGHTEEDFRRFLDDMKGRNAKAAAKNADQGSSEQHAPVLGEGALRTAWRSEPGTAAPAVAGPDRFFEQFSKAAKVASPDEGTADPGDAAAAKAKPGKASKFTSFFSSQEDTRRQTEPPAAAAGPPPTQSPPNGGPSAQGAPPDANTTDAFQALLLKLKQQGGGGGGGVGGIRSSVGPATSPAAGGGVGTGAPPESNNGTPAGGGAFHEPPSSMAALSPHDGHRRSGITSPDPPYPQNMPQNLAQNLPLPGLDRRDDPRYRGNMPPVPPQQLMQDLSLQRQPGPMSASSQSPPASVRPEQMLQDLLLQRQQAASQDGSAPRMGLGPGPGGPGPNMAAANSQTELLMRLMQSRSASEGRRADELLMRMPQPQKQINIPSIPDREAEMAEFARERERLGFQRQQLRPTQGPAGHFGDEQFHRQDMDNRQPAQPTQILQRPPPPGLEHAIHGPPPPYLHQGGGGGGGGGVRVPPQQGPAQQGMQQPPMIPMPPGLGGGHPGNRPMPLNMPNMPNLPNLPNAHNMPPGMPLNLPPNLPPSMLNLPNLPNMPMPNMPNMFPSNFSPSGPFPPDGLPAGLARNMQPPLPGFFGGPPGPPGFMPPPGMGFQGPPPPDGVPFPFGDGRGMPPLHGAGFRRP